MSAEKIKKKRPGQGGSNDIDELRTKQFMFRISESEFAQLNKLYKNSGYTSLAKYCRDKALNENIQTNDKDIKSLLADIKNTNLYYSNQINKLGNNINQITKKVNSGDIMYRTSLELRTELDNLKKLRNEFNAVLKKAIKDLK